MSAYMDVIMAGFGGQGVLLMGNVLANCAMERGLEVTYIPVYGAEMRGGTANCTVVIDSEPIGSPIVHSPRSTVILNQPSLEKFQPRLAKDGVQIINSSLVDIALVDTKRHSVCIPATDIARELGTVKMTNMVALGAWLKATGILPLKAVQDILHKVAPQHYRKLILANVRALEAGYSHS